MATQSTRVHVLSCGAMSCDLTWLLLKPGMTITDRSHTNKPAEWVACPTHAVVVEHPDGRLLWDTSVGRDWETRWAPTGLQDFFPYDRVGEEEYFDSRLRQVGLSAGDLDLVVFSHLHFDHAGNAQMFKDAGARLLCNDKEQEGATTFAGDFQGAHLKADYDGLSFETVSGDTEILPGVTLLEAPGHTWGTMALQVDLPETGTIIFTSDAIYMRDSYGPPPVAAAIVWDNQKWLASVEKIRGIAERTNATVVFGHDADQIKELRVAPEAYYA